MKILLLQGANLVHLGKREIETYGTTTREALDKMIINYAKENEYEIEIFYSNLEGLLIDKIYNLIGSIDYIIINPAGFTYAGYSLRDCLKGISIPTIEVHLTNLYERKIDSVIASGVKAVIMGYGIKGYLLAIDSIKYML